MADVTDSGPTSNQRLMFAVERGIVAWVEYSAVQSGYPETSSKVPKFPSSGSFMFRELQVPKFPAPGISSSKIPN